MTTPSISTLKPLDYPEGSILFDVRYYRKPECYEVIYHDPISNQLEVRYEDPIIDIWFLKEEYRTNERQIGHITMDKCYAVHCKPSQITRAIAINIGGEWLEKYEENKERLKPYELSKLMCECPWVFKADFEYDVYFRLRWLHQYGVEIDLSKITTSYLDIEVDVLDRTLDIRDNDNAPLPINAISLIIPHKKIVALLVLGPRPKHLLHEKFHVMLEKQEKQFQELINDIPGFKRRIIEEDEDNKKYLDGFDIRVHVFDFVDEINLIKTAFDYINKYRPGFVESWNAIFDHNYLMNRIDYLGYDKHKIIIPKEFKTDMLYYKFDNRPAKVVSVKTSRDFMFSSTYSVYVCQMKKFAAVRKGGKEPRSYSLSDVGRLIAGIDKKGEAKDTTFREFAYVDYLNFLLYNVRDTVVQFAIGEKTKDHQTFVGMSYMYATSFAKNYQETHTVRNQKEYVIEKEMGIVQACGLIVPKGIDTAYKAAYVAPTVLNAPTGYYVNGKNMNNIIYGSLDADAKAYYPSSTIGNNIDAMTLLYKCLLNNNVFRTNKCKNRSLSQEYTWKDTNNPPREHEEDIAMVIINTYKNKNEMSTMANFFNAPTVSDCFAYLDAMI